MTMLIGTFRIGLRKRKVLNVDVELFRNVNYLILINGSSKGSIKASRGFR